MFIRTNTITAGGHTRLTLICIMDITYITLAADNVVHAGADGVYVTVGLADGSTHRAKFDNYADRDTWVEQITRRRQVIE